MEVSLNFILSAMGNQCKEISAVEAESYFLAPVINFAAAFRTE
jgi:hypothetical protein